MMESVDYDGPVKEVGGGHNDKLTCHVQPGNVPCFAKPLTHCEGKAYELLQKTPLKEYIPIFYGIDKVEDKEFIILSDITAGFTSPCICDIKIGKRHYDVGCTEEKKNHLLEKQKGSTVESLGARLIDARIRENGQTTKHWDRKQALKFTYEDLQQCWNEFIPPPIRKETNNKLDKLYSAYEETVNQNPGFRMYAGSVLICYDNDNLSPSSEVRAIIIDFAHTHISIDADGGDAGDESYDDGVLVGLSTLLNFAAESLEAGNNARMGPGPSGAAARGGSLEIVEIPADPNDKHKAIKRCIVNPGEHKCIMRPRNEHESEAYTLLNNTPLNEFIPKLYGIENNMAVVEDIAAEFTSACLADFKVGSKGYDIDDSEDKKANAKTKDDKTTTKSCSLRLLMGVIVKNKNVTKVWKKKEIQTYDKDKLSSMVAEFISGDIKSAVIKELQKLKKAYTETAKQNKNFRMYNASVLVLYDGDNAKKAPKCVFSKLAHSHLDIEKEGFKATDKANDDGVIDGLDNLIEMIGGGSSKCCILI